MRSVLLILMLCLAVLSCTCAGDDGSEDSSTDIKPASDDDDDLADDDDDDVAPADDDDTSPNDDDNDDDFRWPFSPPEKTGPYAVGVATIYLTDYERFEMWGGRARELPLEIWYPAANGNGPRNTIAAMVGELPAWATPIFNLLYGDAYETLWSTTTSAYRDVPPLDLPEPFPVIFFSHGLNAVRFQNFTTCEHLASHGFVVLAPDHYADAIFTNVQGEAVVLANPLGLVSSALDRFLDVAFVRDELLDLTDNPQSPWHGRLELENLAIFGHSYGGMTSLLAGAHYPFIRAIAPLNPVWVGDFPDEFRKPFFLVIGANDSIAGLWNDLLQRLWNEGVSDQKIFASYLRGGHYSSTDACLLLPPDLMPAALTGCGMEENISNEDANAILNGYLAAFFKAAFLGDARYEYFLRKNHFPDEIDFATTWE